MALDHASVEVTCSAGHDLAHGKTVACQSTRVIVGLQIAGEHRDRSIFRKASQRFFQQRGLARAWRADEVHAQDILVAITLAQRRGQAIVFAEDFSLYDFTHRSSTSR